MVSYFGDWVTAYNWYLLVSLMSFDIDMKEVSFCQKCNELYQKDKANCGILWIILAVMLLMPLNNI